MSLSFSTLRILAVVFVALDNVSALHRRLDLFGLLSQGSSQNSKIVQDLSMAASPCEGDDRASADAMPYLVGTSELQVHQDFDLFQAELISANRSRCLIRNGNETRSVELGSLRATVDYEKNSELLCASGEGKYTVLEALPVLENWTSPVEQFQCQYMLDIPEECMEGGLLSPCPLLTALHGVSDFTVFGDNVLQSPTCKKQMGVILLVPKIHISMKGHHSFEDLEFLRPLFQFIHTKYAAIIDTSRLYLYGQSMGASGALYGGLASPDLFTDVFSISPQHMWIQDKRGSLIVDGDPTIASVALKWKERSAPGVGRLRNMIITAGKEDLIHGNLTHNAGSIPRTLAGVGILDSTVNVEIRFYALLGHVSWFAAVNEFYNTIWLGQ